MSSYQLPRIFLHRTIEPHWFPRPPEENGSSLDALEKAEQEYQESLNKIAQVSAQDPIGTVAIPRREREIPQNTADFLATRNRFVSPRRTNHHQHHHRRSTGEYSDMGTTVDRSEDYSARTRRQSHEQSVDFSADSELDDGEGEGGGGSVTIRYYD